jgi:hypothetical protein|tara:strand:+ start:232 stop:573 length:342 start_codon:yes stop_codon:yes gene_type:complete
VRSKKILISNKKIILVLFSLLLISCGGAKFVQKSTGSEDVNLVTSVEQNQCEFKGEVKNTAKGYSDFRGISEKNLIQLGKNAAVEKNGNTIIMSDYKEFRGTQSALFKIYFCK